MTGIENIIDKIRKLLALSEGAGTQAEAEAALAKAKELLLKYSLTMAEVAVEPDPIRETERCLGKVHAPKWQVELACVVSLHFFCSLLNIRGPYRAVVFVGAGRDSEVAGFVFDYACRSIANLMRGHRDKISFAKGCVVGFHWRLEEVFPKGASRESVNALVLAKSAAVAEYAKSHATRKAEKIFRKPKDRRAFEEGMRAGYKLPLRMPVEADGDEPVALGVAS